MMQSNGKRTGSARLERAGHDVASRKGGVLLVNVGTPNSPSVADVRKYLCEFLSDPLVIRLPRLMRWFQPTLARLIATRRAPHSAEKYRQIWTDRGSPLKAIMEDQAAALEAQLPAGWRVFSCMRYGQASIGETLRSIAAAGIEEIVVIPLYPQYSGTTTGTVTQELYRALHEAGLHLGVTVRNTWYDDAGYLNAQAHRVADYAREHDLHPDNAVLLFSAHGLPVSYIRAGDPYQEQIVRTVELVRERLGWPEARARLAYQSRLGPSEWLKPDLTATLDALGEAGEKRVLVCPISFTVDCLETLEEIGLRGGEDYARRGGKLYVCPALNDDRRFIGALKHLVFRGSHPVTKWSAGHRPLIQTSRGSGLSDNSKRPGDTGLDRLVMLGVSLPNRIGSGAGPRLVYTDADGLACVKKPHNEVQAFLGELGHDAQVAEAFVWNTCQRFECYVWLRSAQSAAQRDCVVADLRARVFDAAPDERVNVLFGSAAWHHLMRTIAGLNSGLPGDKDLVEQFTVAAQLAERANTAGPHLEALLEQATVLARDVREKTAWGRIDPGYCYAALSQVEPRLALKLANCRHVVIGGSATSRSILETLYQQYHVKERQVSLVYRNHQGGQMKQLRKAVGHGRRLRVNSYDEPAVLEAIADADVVYLGIDRTEPVLDAGALRELRDFGERPLTILDFNTAGSTIGLEALAGVTLFSARALEAEVDRFAEALCARDEFPRIVEEAEAWIQQRTPGGVIPSLELPCQNGGATDDAHPTCTRCGRMFARLGAGSETA